MDLRKFAEGNELFKKVHFKKNEESFLELAQNGQSPRTLFIGCSDSRVIPDLIVQSRPGDLFVIRNVGNFVPPFSPDEDYHATATGIEYAVSVLNVSEIIICGHSHCGAINHLFKSVENPSLVHTKKWLSLGEKAKSMALLSLGVNGNKEELLRVTEKLSVITQLENLLTYPEVQRRVDEEDLHIYGWYYDIETGSIDYYDPDTYQFIPLNSLVKKN
ncbi:MAG: carbonic anhydrase [Thiovulaceae bacterium]|nr:carbonic anhydrase [Sulfurimonadaceae bacterium]